MKNIKYFISIIALLFFFTIIGGSAMANDAVINETDKKDEIINAEDIGIEIIEDDVEVDTEEEIIEDDEYESDEEIDEDIDDEDVELESPEPPEDMCEGYEEGVYFEPNHFGDCEIHEYCYICPTCTFEEDVYTDVDEDGNTIWMANKACVVCGHGTCEDVTEEYAYDFDVNEDDIEDEDVEYDINEEFDYEDEVVEYIVEE